MANEICTIDIGNGFLDSNYTFNEDGSIKHFYDQNMYKLNQERWVDANEISASDKEKILKNCAEEYRQIIQHILK